MNINFAQLLGAVALIVVVSIAGFLVATEKSGWGWFLFVALLLAGAIFK